MVTDQTMPGISRSTAAAKTVRACNTDSEKDKAMEFVFTSLSQSSSEIKEHSQDIVYDAHSNNKGDNR